MCAELKLRKHQINKLDDMNINNFELMVDRLGPTHSEYEDWFLACKIL